RETGGVGGDANGGAFLAFGDDLEQRLGAAGIDLDVAEFVEQVQVEAAVAGHERDPPASRVPNLCRTTRPAVHQLRLPAGLLVRYRDVCEGLGDEAPARDGVG